MPAESWNAIDNYYPGDAYVDWVGVDFYGLKWGDNPPGAALDRVYATHGSVKPIMIAETSAADCSNYAAGTTMTKAQWTTALFDALAARPNVHAFFWFNQNNAGEADWRITSCPSPAAQDAYRAGVANARYLSR